MQKINRDIIRFFYSQGCVVVSTIDKNGFPHSACKGIIKIDPEGRVWLLDVYRGLTHENLEGNSHISITAFDEHSFIGYCLKGKAELSSKDKLSPELMQSWEERITSRLTQRLLRNIHQEKGHSRHPEALLPKPEYMIVVEVEGIVDLTPKHLK
ncbi:MAG: pyridoxamine 5'-phosphate oxidase family protein [Candidatus Omnitrophica bacterium]|nr:pyridoxamine 5'-phosphate oxidase family protein [Candidatus Omnitrophota bacterium]